MRMDIQGHTNGAMTQQLLYHFWMNIHRQQDGRCAVPQIVKPHMWQTSFIEQFVKQLELVARIEIGSFQPTDHKVEIMPGIADYTHLISPKNAR